MAGLRTKPDIRYEEFTDAWTQRKLSCFLETSKEKNENGDFLREDVLSVSGDFGIVNQIEFQGRSFAGVSISNYGVVNTNDVVYTKSPLKDNPFGIIKTNKGRSGVVSTLYAVYKPKVNTDSNFVQCYFEPAYRVNNYLHPLVNKGAKNDMKVSADNALLGLVIFPSHSEQIKIAALFDQFDHLITLHQREYDKTVNIKKAMLEKMFPKEGADKPEIRFVGFTDSWEQLELGGISKVIDPHPSHRAPAESKTGIPFIGIGDVDEVGNINHGSARIVDEAIYDEHHNRYDLTIPSIGIGRVASLGKVIRLRNDIGKYAVSPTMSVIQFHTGNDLDYLYAFMNTPSFQSQFKSLSNGSTRQSVGIQDLRELQLAVPVSTDEQKQIGMFFSSVNNLITLHQRELEKLQNMKKALLEKMFI